MHDTGFSVHDTTDLEARGLPSVFVATTEFVDGADAQAREIADKAIAAIFENLVRGRS